MSEETLPEPDRVIGAPHPRETEQLLGQSRAEADFLEAFATGRMHHGWLITGPKGVGKATLAWRMAKFLLAQPPAGDAGLFGAPPPATSLDIGPDHPVAHRMAALSEPGLFLLRRPYDQKTSKLRQEITVDEVRKLKNFFALSATDGGRRVVIVDAADELNVNAANALLKLLEEPPEGAVLLMISHQPSRLLPTIRSRCRELRCHPLRPEDMTTALANAGAESVDNPTALAALAAGSVGEALRMINLGGLTAYEEICGLMQNAPGADRQRALRLAESVVGKGKETRYELVLTLFDLFLARLARHGVSGPAIMEAAQGESQMMSRLSPSPEAGRKWAELQQELGARSRHGRAVNLDPAALILDMVLKMDAAAGQFVAR